MNLIIPPRNFSAYLFDCDGTIADSMPLHYLAWNDALKGRNCHFSEELFYAWAGTPGEKIVQQLNEQQGLSLSPQEVVKVKEEKYFELLPQIRPIPEVVHHIHKQHGCLPMAVVSGSPRESVILTLRTLGLSQFFDIVIGAEDYQHGKPDPEAFLLAAERLKVSASDCLVFEDADLGIQAAISAGMSWVKVPAPPRQGQSLPVT